MSGKPEVSKYEINASTPIDSSATTALETPKLSLSLRPLRPLRKLFPQKPSVPLQVSARGIGDSSDSEQETEPNTDEIDTKSNVKPETDSNTEDQEPVTLRLG